MIRSKLREIEIFYFNRTDMVAWRGERWERWWIAVSLLNISSYRGHKIDDKRDREGGGYFTC